MGTSRFKLDLRGPMDEELDRMAREQSISKAEAVSRAIVGYANLRRLISHDRELILRQRGQPGHEQRVIVL